MDEMEPRFDWNHLSVFQKEVADARQFAWRHNISWLLHVCNDVADVVNEYYTRFLPAVSQQVSE